jgi:ribosomal protein S8
MNTAQINLLISLKNTACAGKESLNIKYNYRCLKLISFLYLEGLIQSFCVEDNKILIYLRFFSGTNKLKDLKLLYKKSYANSLTYKMISKIRCDKNLIIFSTDKGFLNLANCKSKRLGGKILFIC